MCVNCNLVAPVKHSVCDLLGIEHNRYGFPASTMNTLESVLSCYKRGNQGPSKLGTYLAEKGYDVALREAARGDGTIGPTDNAVINFVFSVYFHAETKEVPEEVFERMNERVPFELLSFSPSMLREHFKEVTYRQKKRIPRKVLESWKVSIEDIGEHCRLYGIGLLDDPITEDEPVEGVDYIRNKVYPL